MSSPFGSRDDAPPDKNYPGLFLEMLFCRYCGGVPTALYDGKEPRCAKCWPAAGRPRHRTVGRKWKDKRRSRDASRIPLVECEWCGRADKLDRHHDWSQTVPHGGSKNPRPVVLCKPCHDTADDRRPPVCQVCCKRLETLEAYKLHVAQCGRPQRPSTW